MSRAQLVERADTFARHLRSLGVGEGQIVTLALPNNEAWIISAIALWKLGAIPGPVSPKLPPFELEALVELADAPLVLGTEGTPAGSTPVLDATKWLADNPNPSTETDPLPDIIGPPWKAATSGGSTGRPKLILSGDPAVYDTDAPSSLGFSAEGCLVMPGPLYHNGPVVWSVQGMLQGKHLVLLPKFDSAATLQAIETHKGDTLYMVPTMMKRVLRLPTEERLAFDLSSLQVVWHLAEPCPMWLKEAWIDWLGPEKIVELYAGTEAQVATVITGVEWLEHRGSVGRPLSGSVLIADEDGNEVPARTMGEVWLKSGRDTPTYTYVGAEARTMDGGWESLGDNGYVDEDGYLYLGDRLSDMILSGGANIYPAEIEAALQEHPSIESVAIIGLPDEDMGNTVHAIVQADPAVFDEKEVLAFLADRLAKYKLPRSFEIVDEPLRNDAGKVRRSELRAQRVAAE